MCEAKMIKLEELTDLWNKDSTIDESNISREILNIPQLHAKYIKFLNDAKLATIKCKFDYASMKELRSAYYLGQLDEETLREKEWDQFDLHITKGSLERYLEADVHLNKIAQRKFYYEQIVSTCESILNELKQRTWQLKCYVDYVKFLNGS